MIIFVYMSITRRLIFLGIFWSLLFLIHAFIYTSVATAYGIWLSHWYIVVGLLSALFIVANIVLHSFDGKVVDAFYFMAASWLGIVFIFFSAIVFYEIVGIFIFKDSVVFLNSVIVVAILSSIYALYQGKKVTTREYEIPLKGLNDKIKIVHLSDVHIGTIHQAKFLERIVQKSNSLNPDVVLMTGDLFDGSEPIREKMLKSLNLLTAPSYFSIGNHEVYEGLDKVKETILNLNMKLLDGRVAKYKDLQIIGVNDRQSLPQGKTLDSILDGLTYDKNKPTILMYHTPVEWDAARKHGIDLMLSGHTHNGQIFPFILLVRISYKYINGLYENESKFLHVSPGTGTWGPPMRLGSKNQITLLTLVPK